GGMSPALAGNWGCHDQGGRAADPRAGSRRGRRSRRQAMVLSAGRVPARDGRRLALQGPLPLGDHLRNCGAVSLRLRFLFDAVPSRDSVLRDHRSRGGGRVVAGGGLGGGGGGPPPPPPRWGGGPFFPKILGGKMWGRGWRAARPPLPPARAPRAPP